MTNAEQDMKIAQTKQEVDDFKSIIENFIQEMRDRDNKRDVDIRELRAKHDADMKALAKQREEDMKAIQEKHETLANELRGEIHSALRNIQGLTIAAIIGIVAIAVSVIVFVWQNATREPQIIYQLPPIQTQNYTQPQNQNNLSQ